LQFWNGNTSWVNGFQYTDIYDDNNFIKSSLYKEWNTDGTMITADSSINYFNTVITGINELTSQKENITVYPNPSKGMFTISSKNHISAVEIYNLTGERIYADYKLNQQTSKEINFSTSPKGIYLVKVYNRTKSYNRKVVIQ